MLSELDRKILKIIIESKNPVSSKYLSDAVGCAINTLRKEIDFINNEISEHGVEIISKTSLGIYLQINDEEKGNKYLARVRSRYERINRLHSQYEPVVYYIIRSILAYDGRLTMNKLNNTLYLSTAKMNASLEDARKELSRFNLELVIKRGNHLMEITGSEFDIRQCMIYQHKRMMLDSDNNSFDDDEFNKWFYTVEDNYIANRETLNAILEEQDKIYIPEQYFPKIIHYYELAQSRNNYYERLTFSNEQKMKVMMTEEYNLSKKIFSSFKKSAPVEFRENDIFALSMLLMSFESINNALPYTSSYALYREEATEILTEIMGYYPYYRNYIDEDLINQLIIYLYTLENRLLFSVVGDQESTGIVEKRGISGVDICTIFCRLYERKHNIKLSGYDALSNYYLWHHARKKNLNYYYAQNALVISRYGYSVACSLADNYRIPYSKILKKITPIEAGMVNAMYEDYDLILCDSEDSISSRKHKLPLISADFKPGTSINESIDNYIRMVRWTSETMYLKKECFKYTEFTNTDEIYAYAAKCLENESIGKEEIYEGIKKDLAYISPVKTDRVALFPVLYKESNIGQILVIVNNKDVEVNEKMARVFVFYTKGKQWKENCIINDAVSAFMFMQPHELLNTIMKLGPLEIFDRYKTYKTTKY